MPATSPAWVSFATDAFLTGKPMTGAKAQGLNTRPLSIAAMVDDAPPPQNVWHPYDMSTIGDGTDGAFWDFAVDGVSNDETSPDFEDDYDYMVYFNAVGNTAGNQTWQIKFYQETAAAYTATTALNTTAPAGGNTFWSTIFNARNVSTDFVAMFKASEYGSNNTGTIADITQAIAASDKVLRFNLTTGGNWNSGSMHLFRRKSLILF